MVNADRLANGLSELPLDEELCAIARVKARDMEENRYFSHTSPTYGRPAAMLTHFGYSFKSVSENIAHYGTVEKAEAGFMSSAMGQRYLQNARLSFIPAASAMPTA